MVSSWDAAGWLVAACRGRAHDGCPGDGMGANGETQVGGAGAFVKTGLVDVEGCHGDVVVVDAGTRRGRSADVLVGTGVPRQLEGAAGEQGPPRRAGAGRQRGRGGGD